MANSRRPKLTRSEQRYNYAIAIAIVVLLVVVILVSPALRDAPIIAIIGAAFLFGLVQMIVGLVRRRRYLKSRVSDPPDGV